LQLQQDYIYTKEAKKLLELIVTTAKQED